MQHEWYGTSFVRSICLNCGRSGPGPIDECPGQPPEVTISRHDDLSAFSAEDLLAAKKRLRIDRFRIEATVDAITDEELRRSVAAARSK